MSLGYIHSIESMGLVDGPGVRTVVFMQGCHLRCRYCHNPDTWELNSQKATPMTPDALLTRLLRFKPYYGSDGGVTFSGGEPLLQAEFLSEVLPKCKNSGISTCLDTAGFTYGDYSDILKYTDLILFDIKHYTPEGYFNITGQKIDNSLKFLEDVQSLDIPLWLRHVVVPGLTDSDEHLEGLYDYIKGIKNVHKIELLPYHTLGVSKYKSMNIPYTLEGIKQMDKSVLAMRQARMNKLTDLKTGGR